MRRTWRLLMLASLCGFAAGIVQGGGLPELHRPDRGGGQPHALDVAAFLSGRGLPG
jgi:hypothetical protein